MTTRAVLLEIGNALSKQRYRQAAVQLLASLEADPAVDIVPMSEPLYARAVQRRAFYPSWSAMRDKTLCVRCLKKCLMIPWMSTSDAPDLLECQW